MLSDIIGLLLFFLLSAINKNRSHCLYFQT